MRDLGFTPCLADTDVWMRPAVDTTRLDSSEHAEVKDTTDSPKGERYWEYVLIHVDDLLVASRRATEIMESISQIYKLKENQATKKCYGPPEMYLGTRIHKWRDKDADPDDPYCWPMSGDHYVKTVSYTHLTLPTILRV